ncbi:MAG: hypothetical protein D6765_15595 [Bacteroidetes bacterium]|nr:MAG: hypothetical protein D6765_15595 [Bacteroidota bacterium]
MQAFKRKFFERFGTVPNEEAFLGYDVTLFFGRMLQKYGTALPFNLEKEPPTPLLQTTFAFERVVNQPTAAPERFNPLDQFENKFVNILKFENYYFQPAE